MWLKVLTGARAGKLVRLSGERFLIGSARESDLVLPDAGVAARHAALRALPGGGYAVEDLGSAAGTFVAGVRIRAPVALEGSERLCVGETFLDLVPEPAARRRRRRLGLVAGAAGVVLAAAGATAALLAPHTGSDVPTATLAAPKPPPPPASIVEVEPAAETVPDGEPEPAEAPVRRATVVREDFSDPASGWEEFDAGVASSAYEGGALALRVSDPAWYATSASPQRFAAPSIRVTVENPAGTTRAGFGVLCAYRGERSFLAAGVGTDGTFAVLRNRAGVLEVLSSGGAWAASDAIPVGAPRYDVRATCRNGTMRLSVNGRLVTTAPIPRTAGHVGFFAAGLAEFRFDDVVVADRA